MELQEQISKEREKLAKLDAEKAQAEQQGDQAKVAELAEQVHRTHADIKALEAQADLLATYSGEEGHEPEAKEEMEVSSNSRTVYQRGGRATTFRSSIYDVADRMGMNATVTKTSVSVELDSTQRGMVSAGVTTLDDLAKNQQQSSSLDKMRRDFDRQHQSEEKEREQAAEKLSQFVRGGTAERGQVQQSDRHQEQDAELSGSFGPARDYKPEPQPEQEKAATHNQTPQAEQEAAQGVEIDGQHFRHIEDGDRVRGEIVNTVEMEDGSKFYAVEATGPDWETDRVLVPATEQEHEIGDRIRATMQADEVNTREDANELTR
jgi:hypothetical protein